MTDTIVQPTAGGILHDSTEGMSYLDTLPNTHLTPTDDPTFDKVKLAVQQNIGAAVAPNGNPQQVLDDLQKQAEAGS